MADRENELQNKAMKGWARHPALSEERTCQGKERAGIAGENFLENYHGNRGWGEREVPRSTSR